MANRAVFQGHSIELSAYFIGVGGGYADPTDPKVSIYPPGHSPDLGATSDEAWVYRASLTSGGTGPHATSNKVQKIDVGKYKYVFTVPSDADIGMAYDQWEGTLNSRELKETLYFVIVGTGAAEGDSQLYENNIVFIQLDSSIAATDGTTLGSDIIKYFTTTYNPLYSSLRRIKMDLGPLISNIPDDTINLAIFEASLAANANTFSTITNSSFMAFAKREYSTCLAELTLVRALMGDVTFSDRMSKTLGDLSVSRGGLGLGDKAKALENCVARWQVAIQSGGAMSPDVSLRPGYSVKGAVSEDGISVGRGWEPTTSAGVPAGNDYVQISNRRWQKTYTERND